MKDLKAATKLAMKEKEDAVSNEEKVKKLKNDKKLKAKKDLSKIVVSKFAILKGTKASMNLVEKEEAPSAQELEDEASITTCDKWIATMVTLLYLLYPTITRSTFQLVACQYIGTNACCKWTLMLPASKTNIGRGCCICTSLASYFTSLGSPDCQQFSTSIGKI